VHPERWGRQGRHQGHWGQPLSQCHQGQVSSHFLVCLEVLQEKYLLDSCLGSAWVAQLAEHLNLKIPVLGK